LFSLQKYPLSLRFTNLTLNTALGYNRTLYFSLQYTYFANVFGSLFHLTGLHADTNGVLNVSNKPRLHSQGSYEHIKLGECLFTFGSYFSLFLCKNGNIKISSTVIWFVLPYNC